MEKLRQRGPNLLGYEKSACVVAKFRWTSGVCDSRSLPGLVGVEGGGKDGRAVGGAKLCSANAQISWNGVIDCI